MEAQGQPPTRGKPLTLDVILATVAHLVAAAGTPFDLAVADCLVVGFYFLLRPGEYTGIPRMHDDPFRIQDVQRWIGDRRVDPLFGTLDELLPSSLCLSPLLPRRMVSGPIPSVTPSFVLWPALFLASSRYAHKAGFPVVSLSMPSVPVITRNHRSRIRIAVALHPELGRNTADYSARSTRAGGAMAMLWVGIDGDRIRLIG